MMGWMKPRKDWLKLNTDREAKEIRNLLELAETSVMGMADGVMALQLMWDTARPSRLKKGTSDWP